MLEILPQIYLRDDGMLFLAATRTLVAADLHLGYEELIGAVLPLFSLSETVSCLARAIRQTGALELVLLGDVIHGSRMSERTARAIREGLDRLRERTVVFAIAGNHEGAGRGRLVLGPTHETLERDGWILTHGDEPPPQTSGRRAVIGHLHPALHCGGSRTAQAFIVNRSVVVVPAQTPFSPGLDVGSEAARAAVAPWARGGGRPKLVVVTPGRIRPFGFMSDLRRLRKDRALRFPQASFGTKGITST